MVLGQIEPGDLGPVTVLFRCQDGSADGRAQRRQNVVHCRVGTVGRRCAQELTFRQEAGITPKSAVIAVTATTFPRTIGSPQATAAQMYRAIRSQC
jgi:hypothetical protein